MEIYRKNIVIADIELDEKSQLTHAIMGDEIVTLSFSVSSFIEFGVGDYILYSDMKYRLNNIPQVKKEANDCYAYSLEFEAQKYELGKVLFLLDGNSEFDLLGDAEQFLTQIVYNMNRVSSETWTMDVVAVTDWLTLSFSDENCLSVIDRICEELDVEFEVLFDGSANIINIRDQIGYDTGLTLGYKNGIKKLTKKASDDDIITKLYAFGGSDNLPDDYDYTRLTISALAKNTTKYGIIEAAVTFDDIYPSFTGTIESVETSLSFIDTSIDFDLNDYLVSETTAKVVFLSGDLSGYEFEVESFDYSSKTVTIIEITDDLGQTQPNENFVLAEGDQYTFVDIYMPQSYIDDAEAELLEKATEYIEKYSSPIPEYDATLDQRYLRKNEIELKAGNELTIDVPDMNIDETIRISKIVQSVVNKYNCTVELSEGVKTSKYIKIRQYQNNVARALAALEKQTEIIKNN